MAEKKLPPKIILAIASIGHHSRVSNLVMTDEQTMRLNFAEAELKDIFDELFPEWDTINIEVSKYE